MKHMGKWTRNVLWAIEDLFLVLAVLLLSFRFIIPVHFGRWGGGYKQWKVFLVFVFELWILFAISRRHKSDT